MAERKTRRKPGRPALPPGERKLASLGFRPTPELRLELERAAQENGRSVSKEIESRLENSFLDEDSRNREFGGKALRALFRMLGAAAEIAEARTNKSWDKDQETYLTVKYAWEQLIRSLRPAPSPSWAKREAELNRQRDALPEYPVLPKAPHISMLVEGWPLGNPEEQKRIDQDGKRYYREMATYEKKIKKHETQRIIYHSLVDEHLRQYDLLESAGKEVAASLLPPHKA